jgi:hypothetical protein
MGATKRPTETECDEKVTLGNGLGRDFEPLGRRIMVPKARDGKPLKIKRQPSTKKSDH